MSFPYFRSSAFSINQSQTCGFLGSSGPCGVCRQVMAEFCKADFEILLAKDMENWKSYTLEQLLPERFTL